MSAAGYRVKVREALEDAGYDTSDVESTMSELVCADTVPACCSEGCMVEPDGTCEHGQPSVLLRMGLI